MDGNLMTRSINRNLFEFLKGHCHMYILGYFIAALAKVISYALTIYLWIIVARAVLSWVSPDPYNPIVRFIHNITEPVLSQIRKRLPVHFGGIDLSPIIVFLIIIFLQTFLVSTLSTFSETLLVQKERQTRYNETYAP